MTPAELVALARSVGFDAFQARIMAAIALGESGGDPAAIGDTALVNGTWGPSVGLWQIRSLRAQQGTGGVRDQSRLSDPAFNARSARAVYEQQGYRAWTVFTSGAYGKHLRAVDAATDSGSGDGQGAVDVVRLPGLGLPVIVPNIGGVGGAVTGAVDGINDGLDSVGSFLGQLGERGTWVRVLQVVGGVGLVGTGLLLLGRDIAKPAVSALADVVPAGRAVKAATSVAAATRK